MSVAWGTQSFGRGGGAGGVPVGTRHQEQAGPAVALGSCAGGPTSCPCSQSRLPQALLGTLCGKWNLLGTLTHSMGRLSSAWSAELTDGELWVTCRPGLEVTGASRAAILPWVWGQVFLLSCLSSVALSHSASGGTHRRCSPAGLDTPPLPSWSVTAATLCFWPLLDGVNMLKRQTRCQGPALRARGAGWNSWTLWGAPKPAGAERKASPCPLGSWWCVLSGGGDIGREGGLGQGLPVSWGDQAVRQAPSCPWVVAPPCGGPG